MFDDRELRQQICVFATDSGFTASVPDNLLLLALGGSDRRFYRVPAGKTSCIAMVSPPPGDEQKAWLEINHTTAKAPSKLVRIMPNGERLPVGA